jgi:hypothetical protein
MKINVAAWALVLGAIFASAAAAQETKESASCSGSGFHATAASRGGAKLIENARPAGLGDITVTLSSSATARPSTTLAVGQRRYRAGRHHGVDDDLGQEPGGRGDIKA